MTTTMTTMLSDYQREVCKECLEKGSGGLSLPMGSGKTLIALHLSQTLSPNDPILVVCSKTLLTTWEKEIHKFFPHLSYQILHKEWNKRLHEWTLGEHTRLVLTTTEVLTKAYRQYDLQNRFVMQMDNEFIGYTNIYHAPDFPLLTSHTVAQGVGTVYTRRWGCLVVDEAHNYCNIEVDKCRCIASLCVQHRWLLSGTLFAEPNPRNLLGYYTLLKHPDSPGDLVSMAVKMRSPTFPGVQETLVHRASSGVAPLYQIHHELIPVPMTEEEIMVYERIKKVLKRIHTSLKTTLHPEGRRRFASYLLAMITYLRQIMIAPIIVLASVAVDVCRIRERSELSEILMSELREAQLQDYLESPRSLYSSRLNAVMDQLALLENTPRVLIFSAFRTSLRLLQVLVEERFPQEWQAFTLESGTNKKKVLDAFAQSPRGILFLTYKTGAEGLNLQHTDTVLLLDTMWNASTGEQAVARVARQGQLSSHVRVLTFLSSTGIEEAILEKHIHKMDIAGELMTGPATKNNHHMKVEDIVKMVLKEDNESLFQQVREKLR